MSADSTYYPSPASIRYVSFNQRDEMAWELLVAANGSEWRQYPSKEIELAYSLVDLFLERAGR